MPINDLDRLRVEYAKRALTLNNENKYSLFNIAHLFMIQNRQRNVLQFLAKYGIYPLNTKYILEVGCGEGQVLSEYLSFGAEASQLYGMDLLEDRLRKAHNIFPFLPLTCADAQALPYQSSAFDIVVQYTAFSSILDNTIKGNIAKEMLRVLKPNGLIIWYDFWLNPRNKHTRGISPREIEHLFPSCSFDFQKVTLAPPLTRFLVSKSWIACQILEKVRLLNTHYLAVISRQ